MKRLGILLSGRGSNFLAIHEAIGRGELDAEIVAVISNRLDAPGLARARALGLSAFAIDHRAAASREEHEGKILATLRAYNVELVALAGYMRTLTSLLIDAYPNRILNIHPSLLPSFPGVDAQSQAVEHGVRISGCTVHLVDTSLDGGPILVQRAVEVLPGDTAETLAARILVEEHRAYIEALRMVIAGVRVVGRCVVSNE